MMITLRRTRFWMIYDFLKKQVKQSKNMFLAFVFRNQRSFQWMSASPQYQRQNRQSLQAIQSAWWFASRSPLKQPYHISCKDYLYPSNRSSKREAFSRWFISERCSNILVIRTYKPFEATCFEESKAWQGLRSSSLKESDCLTCEVT